MEAYNEWKEDAEENCSCDVTAKVVINAWNDSVKAEVEELVKQENVNNFKVYMAYKVRLQLGVVLCRSFK